MGLMAWIIEHWTGAVESAGIIGGLLFTGFGYFRDARVRRVETLIEITKQHRELWTHLGERPESATLFDRDRDLDADPVTDREVQFVNLLLLHLRATFYARRARIYIQPERIDQDIRSFFSYPASRAVWERLKNSHDRRFIAFIERKLD
jgi:hypothetical protein